MYLYAKLTDTLKQRQYLNYTVREMIVLLTVAQSNVIDGVPAKKVGEYNEGLLDYIRVNRKEILDGLDPDAGLSEEMKEKILAAAQEYLNFVSDEEAEGEKNV